MSGILFFLAIIIASFVGFGLGMLFLFNGFIEIISMNKANIFGDKIWDEKQERLVTNFPWNRKNRD